MNSAFTPEEIERFLNNELDGEKAEQIASYLSSISGEQLEHHLPDSAITEIKPVEIPGRVKAAMRRKIKRTLKGGAPVWQKPLLMAACLIGILLGGNYLLKLTKGNQSLQKEVFDLSKKTVINNTIADKYIHLPDGSGILLKPQASVSYLDNFLDNRFVYMEGNARFDVKHNDSRPFTVIANGIGTLDIGTSFWINNNKSKQEVTVKLLEGSIAVKSLENSFPAKNIYLQPGQQIKILKNAGNYFVTNIYSSKQKNENEIPSTTIMDKQVVTNWTNAAYSFSKSPLQKVFDQLALRYQVEIKVNPAILQNREFTGKIMYSDSLNVLLDAICNLNHLNYTRKGNKVQITE